MKKTIIISIAITALLMAGCNKDPIDLNITTTTTNNININLGYNVIIKGVVYNEMTNTSISDVVVSLDINGGSTVTDSLGKYRFEYTVAGSYRLKALKTGYSDVNTDNIIKVLSNDTVINKDIPMRKMTNQIKLTDLTGNVIEVLDFGLDTNTEMIAFNICNDGAEDLVCEILYSCVWLKSVSALLHPIPPYNNKTLFVTIDRDKLSKGQNNTDIYLTSNNGSSLLTIKAYGQ